MAEVSAEREMNRTEVAAYLREFADELDPSGHRGDDTQRRENHTTETGDRDATHAEQDEYDDSAERLHEERTDAAERMRDDHDDSERDDEASATGDIRADSTDGDSTDGDSTDGDSTDGDSTDGDSTHEDSARSADEYASGERVTFMVGNESATVNPPETVDFEMAVDSDSSLMASGTRETVAFELHWNSEDVSEEDGLGVR